MSKKMDELMARLERTERLEQQAKDTQFVRSGREHIARMKMDEWANSDDPAERTAYETRRHRRNYEWVHLWAPLVSLGIVFLLLRSCFR